MRGLIVIGLLALAAFWAYGRVKTFFGWDKKDDKPVVSQVAEKPSSFGFARGADMKKPEGGIFGVGSGSAPAKPALPVVSKIVSYKYRQAFSPEFVNSLTSLGLSSVYDPASRTVLLRGPLDVVSEVARLMDAGDQVPGFCSVRGAVLFVSDSSADGWDFMAALRSASGVDVTGALDASGALLDVEWNGLRGALEILKGDSRVRLLQEPHVRLLDGQEARIEALEEVPIRSTTVSQGMATESIEYKKAGLSLVLTPEFLPGNRLRLKVSQSTGMIGRTVEISGAEVPVLQTQSVASSLECAIGQTVVLGGVRSTRTKRVKGFLSNRVEVEEGLLYVVLGFYSDAPRARAVEPDWIDENPARFPDDIEPIGLPMVLPDKPQK